MDNHKSDALLLVEKIKQHLTTPDGGHVIHAETLADISRLQLAVETPFETIYRIGYQNACVRIALELGVFGTLVAKQGAHIEVQELAAPHGADPVFLGQSLNLLYGESSAESIVFSSRSSYHESHRSPRPLRRGWSGRIPGQFQNSYYDYASRYRKLQGLVRQNSHPSCNASPDTNKTSSRFDLFTPAAAKLPECMLSQNYQNPTQSNKSAFAYATGTEFWNHLQKSPMNSRIFNDYMATRRRGRQSWFDIYPVDRELSSALPNSDSNLQQESSILLVDVGGNRGHDLIALKSNYPNLAGKMILQDLPK
ncbi:MAG: hypothetical protein Q9226_008211, partial [Calogaya cf. arnoldii]